MQSVFTQAIVDGLRTGDADRDKDGLITVSEIYHYTSERVRAVEPRQTPELWTYGAEGDVLLAYSVRGAIIEPIPLPEDLRLTLESPRPRVRETAVAELAELLDIARPGLVLSVRQALQRISDEDIPQVAAVARIALEASQGTAAREVRQELAERDQRARLSLEAEQAERQKAEERARPEAEQAERQKAEERARPEAEQAERQKAEERARLEAEQAERQKAEEQAHWNATDKIGYASAQVNSAPTPTATSAVTGSGVGRVLWALVPVLSLGVLLPFPFAYAAARLHSRKLWVIAFPYAILWLVLLIVIIVQGSLGHSKAALTASIWLLVFSVIAAVHALRLRRPEAELAARQKAEEQARPEAEQAARRKADSIWLLVFSVIDAVHALRLRRPEAELAARQEAEEQARPEAEQATRQKAEEQAHWNATDAVNGFERALVCLAYLLPIIALITVFRRNSFIRINAIQALMLVAIGLATLATIGSAYNNPRPNVSTPAVSQPWFSILITLGITAFCVSVILVLFCLFRVIQGRLPRIVLLTRMASRLAALVTRINE